MALPKTPGRVAWRRSAAAVGIYSSVALGFLSTVVAARTFDSARVFGLYTLVVTATGFFQSLFDLTVEEALVKYGFRYVARADWGRLRQLFRSAFAFKLAGAALGGIGLLVLAPFAQALWGSSGMEVPLLIAAALPLGQSLEGLAGSALFLRSRYDIRAAFLVVSMALRLAALAVGARYGLTTAVLAVVVAQYASTAAVGAAGWLAFRRFPVAPRRPLAEDRREILGFVGQSSAASGVTSLRGTLVPALLGIVTTSAQVGFFKTAQAPQQGFIALSAPVRMVLLTEQTRDWEHGRQSVVLAGVRRYSLLGAAVGLVTVPILVWLMPDLIRLVYGAKYGGAADASRVFVFAAAVQLVVGWTKSFPVTIGRPGLRVLTHGVESLVVLPLAVVLGSLYGATGGALAVLAGSCVFAGLWAAIFLRIRPHDTPPPSVAELAPGPEAVVR